MSKNLSYEFSQLSPGGLMEAIVVNNDIQKYGYIYFSSNSVSVFRLGEEMEAYTHTRFIEYYKTNI